MDGNRRFGIENFSDESQVIINVSLIICDLIYTVHILLGASSRW